MNDVDHVGTDNNNEDDIDGQTADKGDYKNVNTLILSDLIWQGLCKENLNSQQRSLL